MKRHNSVKSIVFLLVLTLTLTMAMQTANAALTCKNVKTWYWLSDPTRITSVARGDVDGDSKTEIVTGGYYYDFTLPVAQLCVWV